MVDAVHLESQVSSPVLRCGHEFLATSCKDAAKAAELRKQLTAWSVNDALLQPLVQRSALVKESAPASLPLSQAAQLGISALDHWRVGDRSPMTRRSKRWMP